MLTLQDIQKVLNKLDYICEINYDRVGVYFNPNIESFKTNRYTHKLIIDFNNKTARMTFESGVYTSSAESLEICDVYTRIALLIRLLDLEFIR